MYLKTEKESDHEARRLQDEITEEMMWTTTSAEGDMWVHEVAEPIEEPTCEEGPSGWTRGKHEFP